MPDCPAQAATFAPPQVAKLRKKLAHYVAGDNIHVHLNPAGLTDGCKLTAENCSL
jgi:hypothetical protein